MMDIEHYGPWALVTGASSGIGQEFARQLAGRGFHVVLAARRLAALESLAGELSTSHGVACRAVGVDLAGADAIAVLDAATQDVDIGLVISNAGTGLPKQFLASTRDDLHATVRLNVNAHLDIAHRFAPRLVARGRGGLLLMGAMGASHGIPMMANAGATKAYVHSLGEALNVELAPHGVHVTVVLAGPTDTPVIARFGLDPTTMPLKPLSVARSVDEALQALDKNRSHVTPGRLLRIVNAMVPVSVSRRMAAKMFTDGLARQLLKP